MGSDEEADVDLTSTKVRSCKNSETSMTIEISSVLKNSKRKKQKDNEFSLSAYVFGDSLEPIKNYKKLKIQKYTDEINSDKDFVIENDKDERKSDLQLNLCNKTKCLSVWKDDDDDLLVHEALEQQNRKLPSGKFKNNYKEFLSNKYEHVACYPKWAELNRVKGNEFINIHEEIFKHSSHLKSKTSKCLQKNYIDIKVLMDLNKKTHIEGPFINSLQFHETSMIAAISGSSGTVSLFEVDGKENNKLHTIKYEKFPIHTSKFLKNGTELLSGSMSHAFCHSFNLITEKTLRIPLAQGISSMKNFEVSPDGKMIAVCGRLGELHLLTSETKELIGSMKMNKKCRSVVFTPDSSKLFSHGESNEIYIWDLKSRTCYNRAYDDGCISSTALTISPDGLYVATGSKQGAVNIYHTQSILNQRNPKPIKTILNLVTAITKLKFNSNSEILAMASNKKNNAFRMVHLPSMHVFKNFPTSHSIMHSVLDVDFSPGSGYLGIGNNKGFAYLYRLKHYGNY